MSMNDPGHEHGSDTVQHQDAVEGVVEDVLEDASTQAAITNLTTPAGASYVQAEATGTRTAVNQILQVLRDAGLIPAA